MRCPVRVHVGSNCPEPPPARQAGRPTSARRTDLLRVMPLSVSATNASRPPLPMERAASDGLKSHSRCRAQVIADFYNKICHQRPKCSAAKYIPADQLVGCGVQAIPPNRCDVACSTPGFHPTLSLCWTCTIYSLPVSRLFSVINRTHSANLV